MGEDKTENQNYIVRPFKQEVDNAWRAGDFCWRHRIAYPQTHTNSSSKLKGITRYQ